MMSQVSLNPSLDIGSARQRLSRVVPHGRRIARTLGQLLAARSTQVVLAGVSAAVFGAMLHRDAWALLAGVVGILTLGAAWPWISVRGARATLKFESTRICEGEAAQLRLELRNRLAIPLVGLHVRVAGQDAEVPPVLPFCTARLTLELRPTRRGVYPQQPPTVRCAWPFHLQWFSRAVPCTTRLTVWPAASAASLPDIPTCRLEDSEGRLGGVGNGCETVGVRPYRRGDPLRYVHWAQTAKHGRLIVREMQTRVRPTLRLFLDTHASIHTLGDDFDSFESMLRIAASILREAQTDAFQIELTLGERRLNLGGKGIGPGMDALAAVVPGTTHPAPPLASDVMVITTDRSPLACRPDAIVLQADGFPGRPPVASRVARAGRSTPVRGVDQIAPVLRRLGQRQKLIPLATPGSTRRPDQPQR